MASKSSVIISIPSKEQEPPKEKVVDEFEGAKQNLDLLKTKETVHEVEVIASTPETNPDSPPRPERLESESLEEFYSRLASWWLSNPTNRNKVANREWEHIQFSIKKLADKYHNNLSSREAGRIVVGFLNRFYLQSSDELLKLCAQQIIFTMLYEDVIINLHRTNGILPSEQTIITGESK